MRMEENRRMELEQKFFIPYKFVFGFFFFGTVNLKFMNKDF